MRSQRLKGILGKSPNRFADPAIREAFLRMTRHLKSRPNPRWAFDAVADDRAATPGGTLVRDARACLRDAKLLGPAVLDATRHEVEEFFDTLKQEALRDYERPCGGLDTLLCDFAKEVSEAHAAVTTLAVKRSPEEARRVRREVRDAAEVCTRVLEFPTLSLPTHPLPMGVVR